MELIKIKQTETGKQAVQCSELYKGLGLAPQHFSSWIRKNIKNNSFAINGIDYTAFTPTQREQKNSKHKQDFILSLEFAKHLAMQCRTIKGHEIRKYFLLCEQKAKELETSTIQALKKELHAYRRLEQIKAIRLALNKEVRELKKQIVPIQALQGYNTQLTINF